MTTEMIYMRASGGNDVLSPDYRFPPSQLEMLLQSNTVSHWLGANLESALHAARTPGVAT